MTQTEHTVSRKTIRRLVILSIITNLIALAAIGIALDSYQTQVTNLKEAAQHARYSSCQLLRTIVVAAYVSGGHPKSGTAFINNSPLHDCYAYSILPIP